MARFRRFLHNGIFKIQCIHFSKIARNHRSVYAGDPSLKCSRKSNRSHSGDAAAAAAAQFATNNHQPERAEGGGKAARPEKRVHPPAQVNSAGRGLRSGREDGGGRQRMAECTAAAATVRVAGEPAAWSVGRPVGGAETIYGYLLQLFSFRACLAKKEEEGEEEERGL